MTKLQRFIPQTPDPYLKQGDQLGAVKFGHINALVDAINATVFGDYLQLAGDGPMSTTLRALEDPEGNIANLYLATDKTAISGSLKIGNSDANTGSAILQIDSTSQGVLFPRMTIAERDAIVSPAIGLLVYNTEDLILNQWDGTQWTEVGGGGGLGLLDDALMTSTLTAVVDKDNAESALLLSTERIGLSSDSTATTQTTAVIQAIDTNSGIAIVPNGTGAITASIPDGTAVGGNARGLGSVDLKPSGRTSASQVASGNYSSVIGGNVSTASGDLSIAGGSAFATGTSSVAMGGSSTASGSGSVAIGGEQGGGLGATASGRASVAFGLSNTATADFSNSLGGLSNNATSAFSNVSGGQSNTASTGTYATVVGGQSNVSSGQYSISGGNGNTASGQSSVAFGENNTVPNRWSAVVGGSGNTVGQEHVVVGGKDNIANGEYSVSFGRSSESLGFASFSMGYNANADGRGAVAFGQSTDANGEYSFASGNFSIASNPHSYSLGNELTAQADYSFALGKNSDTQLRGQLALASVSLGPGYGTSQASEMVAVRQDILNSAATTVLSLDGTGTTNLIIPNGNNRAWNAKVETIAVVTEITGTVDGVSVGDALMQDDTVLFTRVAGTSSVVGVNNTNIIASTSMGTAGMSFTAGASKELAITFTAPTFTGGGSVTCRVVSKVSLVEVAW